MNLIFCVHGNSGSANEFNSIHELNNDKIKTKAIDFPGCGQAIRSDQPATDYSIRALQDQILNELNQINYDQVLMVGHSLGGHMVLQCSNKIKNLSGIVIFGTPPLRVPLNMAEAFLPNPLMGHFFAPAPTNEDLDALLDDVVHQKNVIPSVKDAFLNTDPAFRTTIAANIGEPNAINDEVEIISALDAPVFVVHSTLESMVNIDYIRSIDTIRSIYEIEHSGHYPSLEQPDEFNQIIREIGQQIFK